MCCIAGPAILSSQHRGCSLRRSEVMPPKRPSNITIARRTEALGMLYFSMRLQGARELGSDLKMRPVERSKVDFYLEQFGRKLRVQLKTWVINTSAEDWEKARCCVHCASHDLLDYAWYGVDVLYIQVFTGVDVAEFKEDMTAEAFNDRFPDVRVYNYVLDFKYESVRKFIYPFKEKIQKNFQTFSALFKPFRQFHISEFFSQLLKKQRTTERSTDDQRAKWKKWAETKRNELAKNLGDFEGFTWAARNQMEQLLDKKRSMAKDTGLRDRGKKRRRKKHVHEKITDEMERVLGERYTGTLPGQEIRRKLNSFEKQEKKPNPNVSASEARLRAEMKLSLQAMRDILENETASESDTDSDDEPRAHMH